VRRLREAETGEAGKLAPLRVAWIVGDGGRRGRRTGPKGAYARLTGALPGERNRGTLPQMMSAALIVLLIGVALIVLNRPVADPTRDSRVDDTADKTLPNESDGADVAPATADVAPAADVPPPTANVPAGGRRSWPQRPAGEQSRLRELLVALGGSPKAVDRPKDQPSEPSTLPSRIEAHIRLVSPASAPAPIREDEAPNGAHGNGRTRRARDL
jgi:hypothetical protein